METIFIVEDSTTQAQRLTLLLEQQGYQAIVAKNGKEALEKLHEIPLPNLLISDVMMPEMNGFELCRQLRSKTQFDTLPIILLTTLSETEDIVKGLESGANFFVTKPYEDDTVIEHIRQALATHQMRLAAGKNQKNASILVNGNEYTITAEKTQILDLLVSIYQAAIHKNQQLIDTQTQLQELNGLLEHKVEMRTIDLKKEIELNQKEILQRKRAQEDLALSEKEYRLLSERLQESLHEKEILLKEVYHRVKNNLQVISSLLNLQANDTDDTQIQTILRENMARVRSMALLHNLLYESDKLDKISMKQYLERLVTYLYDIYNADPENIKLKANMDDILLDIDMGIPCGLIVNEIVSNAFKHAFPAHKSGNIILTLTTEGDNTILSIGDDGVGIPENLDLSKTNSLGMSLIHSLTRELDGNLQIKRDQGTLYTLTFKPASKHVPRPHSEMS